MNKFIRISLIVCVAAGLLRGASFANAEPETSHPIKVEVAVKHRGDFVLALYPKAAPKTVAHFVAIVNKKFYNGILFHRVIPGFVAQAGDPKSKTVHGYDIAHLSDTEVGARYGLGMGGSGTTIPFEKNALTNQPGTIAMALSAPASDTGDSQFFINLVYNQSLDGQYCVFGKVVSGMNVVMKIRQGDRITFMKVLDKRSAKDTHKKTNSKK